MSYQWHPIVDLPSDWESFISSDLKSLSEIWSDHSEKMKNNVSFKVFNERLCREWSIETGIIENLYSLNRGVTQLLIEKGLNESLIQHGDSNKSADHVIAILKDHEEVYKGLFDFVSNKRKLSISYIRELHQVLTRHQPLVDGIDEFGHRCQTELIRGDWKRNPNNPLRPNGEIHGYCPPEQVQVQIEQLLALHEKHDEMKIPPEISAAWLHHAFTQIHPFQDGNGRMARALTSLTFIRSGLFALVIHRDIRDSYLGALERADSGDLKPLINVFADIQKDLLTKALSISCDIIEDQRRLSQVISATVGRIKGKTEAATEEYKKVFDISAKLEESTYHHFHETMR